MIASKATAPTMLAGVKRLGETIPAATAAIVPGKWHGVYDATLTETIRVFASQIR